MCRIIALQLHQWTRITVIIIDIIIADDKYQCESYSATAAGVLSCEMQFQADIIDRYELSIDSHEQ